MPNPPKLPVVSGRDLIKVLTSICFSTVRIRGSHCTLKRRGKITVPLNKELKKGTLKSILRAVERNENIPESVIRRLLAGERVPFVCPLK